VKQPTNWSRWDFAPEAGFKKKNCFLINEVMGATTTQSQKYIFCFKEK